MSFIPPTPIHPFNPTLSSKTSHRLYTPFTTPSRTPARMMTTTPPPAQTIEAAWPNFAEKMRKTGEIPSHDEWHQLLDICDEPSKAIWVINLMRDTGRTPNAATYERVLALCARKGDRSAAFHLVEGMFGDKVLLGDVELPDGMEDVLRKILPPEAFE